MRVFGIIFLVAAILLPMRAIAMTQDFPSWLRDLRQEALQRGISSPLVSAALPDTLIPNERIVRFDRKQPEGTVSFEQYKKNVVTPRRLQEGRGYMRQHKKLLEQISKAYGVEPQYIVALWGIETSFGKNTGGFETVPALVTLAYDGRRSAFFRRELLQALRIIDQGHIGLHDMRGSWAGAMGQCQFMPSSFEKFAQDYNKDGRRDIWYTLEDVFASTAAYLSSSGWKMGQPWGRQVRLPNNFDNSLLGVKIEKSLQFWHDAGVRLLDGSLVPVETTDPVSVIQLGGKGYKAYIVYGNYKALIKWNISSYFATATVLFADLLKS